MGVVIGYLAGWLPASLFQVEVSVSTQPPQGKKKEKKESN
jgi:hypothetical protein